jgi:hypothetical protein
MKIKNWEKYQLYKHKSMPWFKVYGRDLLNDMDWGKLNCDEKATLFELWCLGTEDHGKLPKLEEISYRLRRSEKDLEPIIQSLITKSWLITDTVSTEYSESTLEEKREEESRIEKKRTEKKRGEYSASNSIPF